MDLDKEQLNNFLKEGEDWFKKHHLPPFFPAYIAQISTAVNKFSDSVSKQAESSDRLSRSIKYATWAAVIIALINFFWDVFKTLWK